MKLLDTHYANCAFYNSRDHVFLFGDAVLPGEDGAVSRYKGMDGYDWLAMGSGTLPVRGGFSQ
jgi:hypothetical protein